MGGGDEACGVGWGVRREARGARREAWKLELGRGESEEWR